MPSFSRKLISKRRDSSTATTLRLTADGLFDASDNLLLRRRLDDDSDEWEHSERWYDAKARLVGQRDEFFILEGAQLFDSLALSEATSFTCYGMCVHCI